MMRCAALALLAFCLLAPAARADGFNTLQDLAARHLRPAPLVPTTAPSLFSDLGKSLTPGPGIGKGGYSLRLLHYAPGGPPDAVIALGRGEYASIQAALRDFRRNGYTKRTTRVRGRRAALLTRRARESVIVWSEDGRVYTIATGTQRKVPVSALRATAAGLDHLGANYIGDSFAPGTNNTSFGGVLVTTERHVSGVVEWGTDNCTFNGFPAAAYGGSATFVMLPLRSGAFSLPLNGPLVRPPGWNGTISGTVSTAAINLSLQGSGTFDGEICDTGPMSVSAAARDPD
jgi:hypothetical protein